MGKSNITSTINSTLLTNHDLIENKVLECDQLANDLETSKMKTNTTTDQDLLRMHEEYKNRFELEKNDLKSKKAEKSRKATTELTDSYVKKLLKQQKYPKEMIENTDVVEVKRLIIKTNRLYKSKCK